MITMLRLVIRLGVLALAAFGAKTLYDKFSSRVRSLQGPASEFVQHTNVIAGQTAERARRAAREAMGAATDAADDLQRAADDAKDEAARRLAGSDAGPSDSAAPTVPTAPTAPDQGP
jgi:Tfp pilus assembly protein PilV